MVKRPYKILNVHNHVFTQHSEEEAISFLKYVSRGDRSDIYQFEILDPDDGWVCAETWLKSKSIKYDITKNRYNHRLYY